jgi:hypothetical protein
MQLRELEMGEGDKDDEKELEMVLKSNEANIEQP